MCVRSKPVSYREGFRCETEDMELLVGWRIHPQLCAHGIHLITLNAAQRRDETLWIILTTFVVFTHSDKQILVKTWEDEFKISFVHANEDTPLLERSENKLFQSNNTPSLNLIFLTLQLASSLCSYYLQIRFRQTYSCLWISNYFRRLCVCWLYIVIMMELISCRCSIGIQSDRFYW